MRRSVATRCRRFTARSLFRSLLPPPSYTEGCPIEFFSLSEPLKITSERSKMLLAYSRRSDRGEHAVLHYPKAGNRLNCCRRLIKKDRGPFFTAYWGWGEGRGEIECPILFSAPTAPHPPPLHFLISLRRCWVG